MPRRATTPMPVYEHEPLPATTPDGRQNQMIALAMDLVERRLREGTASSQETTHFLKLATAKSEHEAETIRLQNQLIKAKTDTLQSQQRSEKLYEDAIKAFGIYSGREARTDDNEEDEFYD